MYSCTLFHSRSTGFAAMPLMLNVYDSNGLNGSDLDTDCDIAVQ